MIDKEINQTFIEESLELLSIIEKNILLLEQSDDNPEGINEIFRALHTIKGTSAMLGFVDISDSAHVMENHFDKIRNKQAKINENIISTTLNFCDSLKIILTAKDEKEKQDEIKHLHKIIRHQEIDTDLKPSSQKAPQKKQQPVNKIFRIFYQPRKETLMRAQDPVKILRELKSLGTCYIYTDIEKVPYLTEIDANNCYISWSCFLLTQKLPADIQEVFKFVASDARVEIDLIDEGVGSDNLDYKRIGEILIHQRRLTPDKVEKLLAENMPFGELAVKHGLITEGELESALLEQNIVREERKKRSQIYENVTIRVKNDKLDELVNLVGELVTLEAQLKQFSSSLQNSTLNGISDRLNRLIGELRENSLNLRMIPLNHIFTDFNRLIRDLSIEQKKTIHLNIEGGSTEVDKNVIESLKDPLLHILRNAADHGIESPEERKKLNKPPNGMININAYYSGAYVRISIRDDGGGLNPEIIRKKAIALKMIQADEKLSHDQILNIIFKPGFTTSDKVSKISGRGVGMDVVRKNIEKLRGFISINSELGKGTEFVIRIPLTLAIIDGLLFRVGESYFIINLSSVEECTDFTPNLLCNEDSNVICYRDTVIPLIEVRELFDIKAKAPDIQQIIVVRAGDKLLALQVDRALRKHQTVIKSVSQVYSHIEEVSGATILGDGHIALILDIGKISENIDRRAIHSFANA